jgi:hypothetical protein
MSGSYAPKVYRENGGDRTVVASGGEILVKSGGSVVVESGATFTIPDGTITSAKLAAGAGVAALVAAGLGASGAWVKTDTGTKTLLAAHATKDRAVLVLVHIDQVFATGNTSQLICKVGETSTIEKFAAAAVFTDAAAGATFVFAGTNTATKAILVTLTAAAGTGTGAVSVTVLAIPTT